MGFEPPRRACAPHGLADRPREPSPAHFRDGAWSPGAGQWVSCFPQSLVPRPALDPMGVDPITPILQGSVAPTEHAGPLLKLGISELHRMSPAYEAGEESVSPIPEYPRVESNHRFNCV